jgi:hypothetical protein
MARLALIGFASLCMTGFALAQTPANFGDSAKKMIGTWEFSNADRDKICTVTFKSDPSPSGFKLEFDKDCPALFPLVGDVTGWSFPDNDLLHLVDVKGKALVEFSEVESGIYEAPTPGVGVLFLQNPADAAGPPERKPEQVTGDWAIMRGDTILCVVTLAKTAVRDGLALNAKPGCDAEITRAGLTSWRIDRGELVFSVARGNPWRFEENDASSWRRLPEAVDAILLVKQDSASR